MVLCGLAYTTGLWESCFSEGQGAGGRIAKLSLQPVGACCISRHVRVAGRAGDNGALPSLFVANGSVETVLEDAAIPSFESVVQMNSQACILAQRF